MDTKYPLVSEFQVSEDADLVFSTSVEAVEVLKKQSKHSCNTNGGLGTMHTKRNTADISPDLQQVSFTNPNELQLDATVGLPS